MIKSLKHLLTGSCLALLLSAFNAQADGIYTLENSLSSLSFTSIKKSHVLEAHSFTQLSGQLGASGAAEFEIDLASVDTGVGKRDDRMRNILFDIASFPKAVANTQIDMAAITGLAIGESLSHSAATTLSLHGFNKALDSQLEITRLSDTRISVRPKAPVLIDATEFGFSDGLAELTELASLPSISASVSVNFFLVFDLQNAQ